MKKTDKLDRCPMRLASPLFSSVFNSASSDRQMASDGSQRDTNSLTEDMDGRRSQMTLKETKMGTDRSAPGTPQSHIQKIKETKMITGLRVNRRPRIRGVMKLASRK